jgi:hypothetical protein
MRRRNGDGPADFASAIVDDPSRMSIPDSVKWVLGSWSRTPPRQSYLLPRAYDPSLIPPYFVSDAVSMSIAMPLISVVR